MVWGGERCRVGSIGMVEVYVLLRCFLFAAHVFMECGSIDEVLVRGVSREVGQ